MTKRHNAKYKIDRQLGENLWGRPKSPLNKRKTAPGQHGQNRGKLSDYGVQLRAKQKLKGYYGNIGEKQFANIYAEADRRRGDTGENMIGLLERRLDAVVYRAKFAPTVFSSRQLINHGHILVNGRRLNIPSARLKAGDVITLAPVMREKPVVMQAIDSAEREVPPYIEVERSEFKATFSRVPMIADVPYPVEMHPNLVIEYYSR